EFDDAASPGNGKGDQKATANHGAMKEGQEQQQQQWSSDDLWGQDWNGDDYGDNHGWGYWYNRGWAADGWWGWGYNGRSNDWGRGSCYDGGEMWHNNDYIGPVLKNKPSWYRSATVHTMQDGAGTPAPTAATTTPSRSSHRKQASQTEPQTPEEEQEEKDKEEAKQLLSEKRKKRLHRARYMRFYRGITGMNAKTPPEVVQLGKVAQASSTRREMAYIYESWLASGENWTQSSVYLNITSSTGTRRRGVKRWLTFAEIERQYGPTVAKAIVDHKLTTPDLAETEVRFHPDAPGVEAPLSASRFSWLIGEWLGSLVFLLLSWQEAKQYFVLDNESFEDIKEDWVTRMFKAAEEDENKNRSSPSRSPKPKKKQSKAKAKAKSKSQAKDGEAKLAKAKQACTQSKNYRDAILKDMGPQLEVLKKKRDSLQSLVDESKVDQLEKPVGELSTLIEAWVFLTMLLSFPTFSTKWVMGPHRSSDKCDPLEQLRKGVRRWYMKPKGMNERFVHGFMCEDQMGYLKRLASRCPKITFERSALRIVGIRFLALQLKLRRCLHDAEIPDIALPGSEEQLPQKEVSSDEKLAGRREIEPSSLPSNVKDLREIVHGLAERKRMATEAQIHDETTLDVALSEGVPPGNDSLLTAPGLPTEVESGATRRTFPGFGGLIRWPGNPFAGRGSNPKPDGVTAGSLPAASHSPPPMPPPALPPPPHATPPTMSASASLQATISTGGLPTGGSQRPRSRQSMTSHASAVDMDLDIPDLDTQYAIEVSYGEPQRPMAVTEERHKISLKRTFFEMDLGAAERQQIFEEMGITEERLEELGIGETIFNLSNTMVGSGVLSVPYAFRLTRYVAVALLALVVAMTAFTAMLIGQALELAASRPGAESTPPSRRDFGFLAEVAFGQQLGSKNHARVFPGKKLEAKHGRLDIWKCCTSKLKERGSASRKPLPDGGRPARASGPIRTSHAWSRLDESGTSFSVNPFVDFCNTLSSSMQSPVAVSTWKRCLETFEYAFPHFGDTFRALDNNKASPPVEIPPDPVDNLAPALIQDLRSLPDLYTEGGATVRASDSCYSAAETCIIAITTAMELWLAVVTFLVMSGINAQGLLGMDEAHAVAFCTMITAVMVFIPLRVYAYVSLASLAALCVASVAYLIDLFQMDQWNWPGFSAPEGVGDVFRAYGLIIFCFAGHPCFPALHQSMSDRSKWEPCAALALSFAT
ncbi:unnamed protein product, partial [Symbiodinium sp. KB8]